LVPFISFLLAGSPNAFRFLALPGGLVITVVPVLIYFALPESPRWYLRKGTRRRRPMPSTRSFGGLAIAFNH
jgi:hypothetical protein